MATNDSKPLEHRPTIGDPPTVDPTVLTTQQIERAIGQVNGVISLVREIIDVKINEVRENFTLKIEIVETRLQGNDTATQLVQTFADRIPATVDEKIKALREIMDEKLTSVDKQFRERDVRTEQTSKDSKVAVDAALQAAKEAVGEQNKSSALAIAKSETSTVKQIDQLAVLIQQMTKAFDDKIGDVKDRLTRLEGKGEGGEKVLATGQASNTNMIAVIGLIIGAFIGVGGIVVAVLMKNH